MVRTKAPLLSLQAGGQVGKVLIASNWKGRSYMKKLTIPTNPNTDAQQGVRACLRFITQDWTNIAAGDKATWKTAADADQITNLDNMCRANLLRWSTGQMPGQAYPIAEDDATAGFNFLSAVAWGRGVRCVLQITTLNQNWGVVIYRSTTMGFTAGYNNARIVLPKTAVAVTYFDDTPLAPDTYYYRARPFSKHGKLGSLSAEKSTVVS